MLLYTVHPYLVKTGVALITCKAIESNTLWLTADVSVHCWESEHYLYVVSLFVPMFFIYIVGIPMAILVSVARMRKGVRRGMVTFFVAGFKPSAGLWEVVIAFRKTLLILVLGLLGSSEPVIQILTAMVVLYLFLEWQIRESPFTLSLHNRLESFGVFIQLILTGFSFYFISDLNIRDAVLMAVSYTILALVLGFFVVCIGVLIAQIVVYRRETTTVAPMQRSEEPSFVISAPPPSANLSGLPLKQRMEDGSNG